MPRNVTRREIDVRDGDVSLAGSLFLPETRAAATLLMHPGSGPSDRDNDVYFPPIREHLLDAGVAVCSFDKRGVGGSTGRWQDAGIVEQADDLLACTATLSSDPGVPKPVGLFGHSQGGWVVVEAAGRNQPIAFVVASSGPGVTPAEQERFSLLTYLAKGGVTESEMHEAFEPFDELVEALKKGTAYEDIRRRFESDQLPTVHRGGSWSCSRTTKSSGASCSASSTTTRAQRSSEFAFRCSPSSAPTTPSCRSRQA